MSAPQPIVRITSDGVQVYESNTSYEVLTSYISVENGVVNIKSNSVTIGSVTVTDVQLQNLLNLLN